jgi:CRP-like cAMP-binding protein
MQAPLSLERVQIDRVIRSHPVLKVLRDSALETLAASALLIKHSRKAALFAPKGCFGVIGFGLVKTECLSPRLILHLAGPGEAIDLLADEGRAKHHVVITDSATVVYVNRATVFLAMDAPAATALAFELQSATTRISERLLSNFHASAETRLAQVLTDLLERFGDEREDGSAFISLRLTRTELSSLAGVTVETVIRTLGVWKKANLVTSNDDGGGFEIHDRVKLRLLGAVS